MNMLHGSRHKRESGVVLFVLGQRHETFYKGELALAACPQSHNLLSLNP